MPEKETWERFFQPDAVLRQLGLFQLGGDLIEFGCGYGTFTFAAASSNAGMVYTFDIEPEMVAHVRNLASDQGIGNVSAVTRDFIDNGTGMAAESVQGAMIFNILHVENPVQLLKEAMRVLKPGGIAGVIHWRRDMETPRGPSLAIRPSPGQCEAWAEEAGFRVIRDVEFGKVAPWHYGLALLK